MLEDHPESLSPVENRISPRHVREIPPFYGGLFVQASGDTCGGCEERQSAELQTLRARPSAEQELAPLTQTVRGAKRKAKLLCG